MPAGFTGRFARRLNEQCQLDIKEAEPGDMVIPGRVLIAPGNHHMTLRRSGARYMVSTNDDPPVNQFRPSVDVLMNSCAKYIGSNAVGVILTGMGNDGAQGLLAMKQAGAVTFAQDEQSCVVYGMPKEAVRVGAVDTVLPLNKIADGILEGSPSHGPRSQLLSRRDFNFQSPKANRCENASSHTRRRHQSPASRRRSRSSHSQRQAT